MTRIVSAGVLVGVLVVILWFAPWWATVALTAVVAALAGHELAGLVASMDRGAPPSFLMVTSAAACLAFVFSTTRSAPIGADGLAAILFAILIVSGLVVLATSPPSPGTLTRAGVMGLGPLYVGLPLGAAAWVHAMYGPQALGWLIAVVAGSDSAQYYVGRLAGRRKLAPAVSPGKTIEGAIGGLVAAPMIGALVAGWGIPGVALPVAALTALVIALFGIGGDLFESLLKRSAGVKDSSTLIPGHGGVLDRLDSYLFALPVFYVFLRYLA